MMLTRNCPIRKKKTKPVNHETHEPGKPFRPFSCISWIKKMTKQTGTDFTEQATHTTLCVLYPDRPSREAHCMRYLCTNCGYIFDETRGDPDNGIAAGTAFAELPDDWVCPICYVSKANFDPLD
jgi:rubredoxin